MDQFYPWLGPRKAARLRLAVMDMWKPFRLATARHAPQASILFDKFHVLRDLGDALDQVRKSEYARVSGRQRRFIKGQKYTLLAHRENLTLSGRRALKTLLAANKRLNTAYLLKESFGQLWDYGREGWARRFFAFSGKLRSSRHTLTTFDLDTCYSLALLWSRSTGRLSRAGRVTVPSGLLGAGGVRVWQVTSR
jgi:transposase